MKCNLNQSTLNNSIQIKINYIQKNTKKHKIKKKFIQKKKKKSKIIRFKNNYKKINLWMKKLYFY